MSRREPGSKRNACPRRRSCSTFGRRRSRARRRNRSSGRVRWTGPPGRKRRSRSALFDPPAAPPSRRAFARRPCRLRWRSPGDHPARLFRANSLWARTFGALPVAIVATPDVPKVRSACASARAAPRCIAHGRALSATTPCARAAQIRPVFRHRQEPSQVVRAARHSEQHRRAVPQP